MQDQIVQIISGIHRLSSVTGRITDHVLQKQFGFGMTQFKIIWVLYNHRDAGGVRQSDIAMWLNQTEAAISRQIRPMSRKKLLASSVDPKNRRSHIVRLTDEGEQLAEAGIGVIVHEHLPYFNRLTSVQQADLAAMLQSLFIGACEHIDANP